MFNFGVVIPTMVVSFSNFSTNLITVVGSTFCDALGSEQIKCIIKCFYMLVNMTCSINSNDCIPSQMFVDL